MSSCQSELLQGKLDLLILKSLALDQLHGMGISRRANHKWNIRSQGRFVVSRSTPDGRSGLAHIFVGRVRDQQTRQVLSPYKDWQEAASHRVRAMGKNLRRDGECFASDLGGLDLIRQLCALWRNILHRKSLNDDLDEEVQCYLEMVAIEKAHHGMAPEGALREARRELGGVDQVKQSVRDIRVGVSMETMMQDLRHALRTLTSNLGFSAVVILTLAFGIGANTAIFTVVNGVLLKPLPYPDPGRLLMLWETSLPDRTLGTVAPANF